MNYEAYIKEATEKYEVILREQLARAEKMKNAAPALDFANMDKIVIGTCGGDGIGPIITEWAKKILEKLLADEIASGRIEIRDIEGLTLENRFACGQSVPDDVLAAIKECHVLLKGPTTTPKGGTGTCVRYVCRSLVLTGPSTVRIPRESTCSEAEELRSPKCFHVISR